MNAPKARALLPPGTPRERIILALWWLGLLFLLLRGNTVFENVATLFAALWAAFLLLLTLLWLPETALALPRRLLKSLAVVTIVAILSMLSTVNPDASVWELARLLSFVSILLAIPPLVREPARWRWAVKSLLILLAAVTLGSLAWYLRAGPPSASHQLLGPFSWYNQMGGFLVMSLPLFLGASASARSPSGRWMFLFLTIAGLLSLLFTFSRGSWLTGIVTVPLALWALRLPRRRIASLLLGALMVGLLAGQRNPGLITDLAARARSVAQEWSSEARTTSGGIRGDAVLVARKALRERFLLGTGPGTFEDAFLRFQRAPWRFAAHAHNEALEMFVELGIAGGAAFALFFLLTARTAVQTLKAAPRTPTHREENDKLAKALGVSVLAALLHFLLDVDWSFLGLQMLFASLLVLLLSRPRPAEASEASPIEAPLPPAREDFDLQAIPRRVAGGVLLAVLGLAALLGTESVLNAQYTAQLAATRMEESHAVARRLATLLPWSANAHRLVAKTAFLQLHLPHPASALAAASALAPWRSEARLALAELAQWKGDTEAARTLYEDVIRRTPYFSPYPSLRLAQLRRKAGDSGGADALLQEATETRFPLNDDLASQSYFLVRTPTVAHLRRLYRAYVRSLEAQGKSEDADVVRDRWVKIPHLPRLE